MLKFVLNLFKRKPQNVQEKQMQKTFVIPGYSDYIYDVQNDKVIRRVKIVNDGTNKRTLSQREIVKRKGKYFYLVPDGETKPTSVTTKKILELEIIKQI